MTRTRLILTLAAVLLGSTAASAQTVNLAWDASTDPTVTGYIVKWGTRAQNYTSFIDVGNRTSWTVNGLTVDQKYYFAVTSYNAGGISSMPSNEVSNNALIVQTGGVLTDQRPSLFWQNQLTGQVQTWHMVGGNVIDTRPLSKVNNDPHWKVAATGDLNGDGYPDILWRHDTQGVLYCWFLQNNTVIGESLLSINSQTDFNWQIRAIGDVNGDGYEDIIWEYNDGTLVVWLMRGATVTSWSLFSIPSVGSSNWRVVGSADVNGDGRADMIFQEITSGSMVAWLLQGTTVAGWGFLSIPQVDPNWRIQTAGNIDGSGIPRLIFRNQLDGSMVAWNIASGYTVTGWLWTNPAAVDNLNWKIVGSR